MCASKNWILGSKEFIREAKISDHLDWKRQIVLLMDEMKIKESFGFVNLGTTNDQLAPFERDSVKTN